MPCPAKNAIHFFATLSHLIFVLHFRFLWQIVWRKPERFLSQIGTPELAVHQWWKFLCQVILIQASSSWTNQASTYCALYGNFPWSNGFSFSFYVFFSFIKKKNIFLFFTLSPPPSWSFLLAPFLLPRQNSPETNENACNAGYWNPYHLFEQNFDCKSQCKSVSFYDEKLNSWSPTIMFVIFSKYTITHSFSLPHRKFRVFPFTSMEQKHRKYTKWCSNVFGNGWVVRDSAIISLRAGFY